MNTENQHNKDFKKGASNSSSSFVRLGLLNLMPKKEKAEQAFESLFIDFTHKVQFNYLKFDSYTPKNVDAEYFEKKYKSIWNALGNIDALIVTGAPIEEIPFEDVKYWEEIKQLLEYAKSHSLPCYFICWAAQAALYFYYDIGKNKVDKKIFGVFSFNPQKQNHPIFQNITSPLHFPASRHTESDVEKISHSPHLLPLLQNDLEDGGMFLLQDLQYPFYYAFGHAEYATEDLQQEYERDMKMGRTDVEKPKNYNIENPVCSWDKNGKSLFQNWLKSVTS